jgi:tricorn protease
VWRGDIWVGDVKGGRAYPVTSHVEMDAFPVFSPDGRYLAFSSLRNGNWDIYVVPSSGGESRQMTFASVNEVVNDWSPDSKSLLYSAQYDIPFSTLYALDVATLKFKKLTQDYKSISNAGFGPDGQAHRVPALWLSRRAPTLHGQRRGPVVDARCPNGRARRLAENDRQKLWPRFLPDGKTVVAVTVGEPTPNAQWLDKPLPRVVDSPARTPNLWSFPADGKGNPRQLTNSSAVRCAGPTVARQTGEIVFEHEHDLYRLAANNAAAKPEKLVLLAGTEDKTNNVSREVLTDGVNEAKISPDGKTFAFGLRGDIWTIPVEKEKNRRNAEDAVRQTDWAGFDRDFTWSNDNKTLFFVSDRQNNDRIYGSTW